MKTDAEQCLAQMFQVLNDIGVENGVPDNELIDQKRVDEDERAIWLEVWNRMLNWFNEIESEK